MLRVLVASTFLVLAMVVVKEGTALERAGLLGSCHAVPPPAGQTGYWHACTVETTAQDGDKAALKLFGSVIERGGRWKIVSYATDF